MKENGILLVNSNTVEKIPKTKARIFKIPATEIAEKMFKAKIYVNMIMIGALTNITKIANEKSLTRAIKETVSTEAININLRAYKKGLTLTLNALFILTSSCQYESC